MSQIRKIMEMYCDRCLGSIVEIQDSTLVWVYRNCDYEMGYMFSLMLSQECQSIIKDNSLSINNGRGYIEIKPKKLNKGVFTSFILNENLKKNIKFDTILYFGSDSEESVLNFLDKVSKSDYNKDINIITTTIGYLGKAKYFIENQNQFKDLLENLVAQYKIVNKDGK